MTRQTNEAKLSSTAITKAMEEVLRKYFRVSASSAREKPASSRQNGASSTPAPSRFAVPRRPGLPPKTIASRLIAVFSFRP
jgi:hypothetical protein